MSSLPQFVSELSQLAQNWKKSDQQNSYVLAMPVRLQSNKLHDKFQISNHKCSKILFVCSAQLSSKLSALQRHETGLREGLLDLQNDLTAFTSQHQQQSNQQVDQLMAQLESLSKINHECVMDSHLPVKALFQPCSMHSVNVRAFHETVQISGKHNRSIPPPKKRNQ